MLLAPSFILFLVIIIEGYVVLSSELIAIRQTIPFVGSGTDTVSIIIAAVLMPLAVGYYFGGQYRSRFPATSARHSVRKKLLFNILVSSVFLLIGLSTLTTNLFFLALIDLGITHRLALTTIYSLIFLVTPVYLLGQTVPLVSNYFSKETLSKITGKMLFFSTVGSFLGAIFSTLVMMSIFGVHHTVTFNFALLTIVVFMIAKKKRDFEKTLAMVVITGICAAINSGSLMSSMDIVSNNHYNTIIVMTDEQGVRHFVQNNTDSSGIGPNGERHAYIEMIEKYFLTPILSPEIPAKNMLIIGAGGFTYGLSDTKNKYVFVDVDPSLEKVATEHFLKAPLTPNKTFAPVAAQSFMTTTKETFDFILVDVYNGDTTIPEDLVTLEFYQSVKDKLNPEGIAVINLIISPTFQDRMSQHLDNTIRAVFPHVGRQVVKDFNGWVVDPNARENTLYWYRKPKDGNDNANTIYTRDKNMIFFDKPQQRR